VRNQTERSAGSLIKPGITHEILFQLNLQQEENKMSAFVIADITVNDPERYEEYKKLAPPAIAAYGGKYLARGGKSEKLEGNWEPDRVVILEFESIEKAKEWLDSQEYRKARTLRHKTASSNMIVVETL
jgi:uncharacterized protein (DUF1330 family)